MSTRPAPFPPGDVRAAVDDPAPLIDRARWSMYLDSALAGRLAQDFLERTADTPELPLRARAWWICGFAALRAGDATLGAAHMAAARAMCVRLGDRRGLLMCDEGDALVARAERRLDDALAIQLRIAERVAAGEADDLTPDSRFALVSSRAITRNLLGQTEEMLRDFYRAHAAAEDCESPGPRINALVNLGGAHGDLYNLHESLGLSEQAMDLAETAGAWQSFAIAGLNVLIALDGTRQGERAGPVVERLLRHAPRLPAWVLPRNAPIVAMAWLAAGDLRRTEEWLGRGEDLAQGDGDSRTDHARVTADWLMRLGRPHEARRIAEARLAEWASGQGVKDQPYVRMRLLQSAAEACERVDDPRAALAYLRQVQALHEELVGRGSRAGTIALQARHDLALARAEADHARHAHEAAERDRQRLAQLNAALEDRMAETERLNTALSQKMSEAEALQRQLREQALRDPLTRLYNRRFLAETAPGRIGLARRTGLPLCVVLLDLDHFKRINDVHGHAAGDHVLIAFSELLTQRFRRSDLLCRFGGEEFLLLLDPCEEPALRVLLEDLLAQFRAMSFTGARGAFSGCTFSAGIAALDAEIPDFDGLLRVADQRMYRAKSAGRAQVLGAAG